jgi:hypothetical protein
MLAIVFATLWLALPGPDVFQEVKGSGCCKGAKCHCTYRGGCTRQPHGTYLVRGCRCGSHATTVAMHGTEQAVFPTDPEPRLPGLAQRVGDGGTTIPEARDLGPEPPPPRVADTISRV